MSGKRWLPVNGAPDEPYRFKFYGYDKRQEEITSYTAMLAYQLLPKEALIWLSDWPEAMKTLTLFLSANRVQSGVIYTIVTDAVTAVQQQNENIAQPCNIESTTDTVIEEIRTQNASVSVKSQDQTETDHQPPLGLLFFAWLQDGLRNQQISVNGQDDIVHIILEFVFIQSPQIFYRYLKENPTGNNSDEDKKQLQKAFEKLAYHHRKSRKAIFTCKMYREMVGEGKFKKMNGYFIPTQLVYVADKIPAENTLIIIE